LPQYRKEKLIREQRATNDRLGIPNPPYSDSSDINAKEEIKLLIIFKEYKIQHIIYCTLSHTCRL
jgi:hypothetical protein